MSILQNFQIKVKHWLLYCFGEQIAGNKQERCHRFLEEALELCQSLHLPKEEALILVDYVYSREIGEPTQELGGVMVTLAALCYPTEMDMVLEAEKELARINQPSIVEKIRRKQETKPHASPLPGVDNEIKERTEKWEGDYKEKVLASPKVAHHDYLEKEGCYVLETEQFFGKLKYYPKANRVLICKDNRWMNAGLRWLVDNLLGIPPTSLEHKKKNK